MYNVSISEPAGTSGFWITTKVVGVPFWTELGSATATIAFGDVAFTISQDPGYVKEMLFWAYVLVVLVDLFETRCV